jgi:hypothetical protein
MLVPLTITLKLEYRDAWMKALKIVREVQPRVFLHKGGFSECDDWRIFHAEVLEKLGLWNPGALVRVNEIISDQRYRIRGCPKCCDRARYWQESIADELTSILRQSYSQFCK